MEIYRPRLTSLSESEVLRYAGQKEQTHLPTGDVRTACRQGLLLASPQSIWECYDYDEEQFRIVASHENLDLISTILQKHLQGCHLIFALAVTIGDLLETEVEALFAQGKYNEALLLDAAGSTAVEATANLANQKITSQLARQGLITTSRFSPGYGDWDLSVQARLLTLTCGDEIGISVTSSSMLTPRKSITAVIGARPEWQSVDDPTTLNDEIPCTMIQCLARKGDMNK